MATGAGAAGVAVHPALPAGESTADSVKIIDKVINQSNLSAPKVGRPGGISVVPGLLTAAATGC